MSEEQMDYKEKTNPLAVIALVMGIIGLVIAWTNFCFSTNFRFSSVLGAITAILLSIAGIVLGLVARSKIKAEGGASSQLKLATAAIIIGIIGGVLSLISLTIAIITTLVVAGPGIEELFQNIIDQLESQ